jgi:hypothetical protein
MLSFSLIFLTKTVSSHVWALLHVMAEAQVFMGNNQNITLVAVPVANGIKLGESLLD